MSTMSLRSRITGSEDTDETTDQTVTDQPVTGETAADGTAVRPTFTPAPDDSDTVVDDETRVPRPTDSVDDVAAQEPTVSERAVPAAAVPAADYTEPGYENSGPGEGDYNQGSYDRAEPVSVEPEQTAGAYETAPVTSTAVTDSTVDSGAAGYESGSVDQRDTDYATVTDEQPAAAYAATPAATATPAEPVGSAVTGKHAALASDTALDGPLFTENPELRGQWQHIQAEFVDDPQHAVADAAELVQQAGQALVSTLQQRQERMRSEWDRNKANRTGTATDDEVTTTGGVDTEQLRQIMQRYRALFDQLSQPV
jgi:hypothetical protein